MATLYYNAANSTDWADLANWWQDDAFTVAATALPTSADSVVLTQTCDYTSGGVSPTVANFTQNLGAFEVAGTSITGACTFNNDASLNTDTYGGTYTFNDTSANFGLAGGDATFNDDSRNWGSVNGAATFNDIAQNNAPAGEVYGHATFNGSSANWGYLYGGATFNGSSVLYGYSEGGDGTVFNDYSYSGETDYSVYAVVNGVAIYNDNSINYSCYVYYGPSTFNDYSQHLWDTYYPATFNDYSTRVGWTDEVSFNDWSGNFGGNSYYGTTFNDESVNAGCNLYGPVTFNDASANVGEGSEHSIFFDVVQFNDNSFNQGEIYFRDPMTQESTGGSVTFNHASINGGYIAGTATFNDASFCVGPSTDDVVLGTRQPYPIPRGIGGSDILGVI